MPLNRVLGQPSSASTDDGVAGAVHVFVVRWQLCSCPGPLSDRSA